MPSARLRSAGDSLEVPPVNLRLDQRRTSPMWAPRNQNHALLRGLKYFKHEDLLAYNRDL